MFSFTNSSRIGWVICDRLGESWLTIPRKRRISLTLVAVANFAIAETLSGTGVIPWPSITCPKYSTDGLANVHFQSSVLGQYHSGAAEPVSIGRRALLVSSRWQEYHPSDTQCLVAHSDPLSFISESALVPMRSRKEVTGNGSVRMVQ